MKTKSKSNVIISFSCVVALAIVYFAPVSFFWRLGMMMLFVFFLFRYGLRMESLQQNDDEQTNLKENKLDGVAVAKDIRIGCLIWLFCAAAISALGWWYPNWVMDRNSSPNIDDRSGGVLLAMFPFYLLAVMIAIRAVLRLGTLVIKERSPGNFVFTFVGLCLAVVAVSPVIIIFIRLSASQ